MSKHKFTVFSIIVRSKVVTRVMDKFIARCLYIPCTKTYEQFSGKVGISRPLIRDSVKECLDIASVMDKRIRHLWKAICCLDKNRKKLKDIFQQSFANKTDGLRSVKGTCFLEVEW